MFHFSFCFICLNYPLDVISEKVIFFEFQVRNIIKIHSYYLLFLLLSFAPYHDIFFNTLTRVSHRHNQKSSSSWNQILFQVTWNVYASLTIRSEIFLPSWRLEFFHLRRELHERGPIMRFLMYLNCEWQKMRMIRSVSCDFYGDKVK